MKNKGVLKKKFYTIKSLSRKISSPEDIKYNNKLIGTTTSHYKNIALALIEISQIKKIKKEKNILII